MDDLAIRICAQKIKDIEAMANATINDIMAWLCARKLEIAPEKTEAVLLVRGRKTNSIKVKVGSNEITSQKHTHKNLGIHLDVNTKMGMTVRTTAEKATKAMTKVGKLISNIGWISGRKKNDVNFYSPVNCNVRGDDLG